MLTTGDKQLEIGGMPYGGGGYYGGNCGGGFGSGFIGGMFGGALVSRRGLFGGDDCCNNGHGNGFANWSKLESIENQLTNQATMEQFNTGIINTNQGFRDVAIQNMITQRDICDLGHSNDMQTVILGKGIADSTTAILMAQKDGEIQNLRDKLFDCSQEKQTTAIENMLNERGLFPGSGPVIQAHSPAVARDNDNLALLLAQNNANSLNFAFNSGIQAGAFGQGQAAAQGIGQGAFQK